MTRMELEAALRTAENSGDLETAEQIAVLLAPYVEREVADLERTEGERTPMWGWHA